MEDNENDDIDVRQILKDLLANKRSIMIAVIVSVVVSISIAFLIPRSYESKGFFSFASVEIPEYRMNKSLYEDVELLSDYISAYHAEDEWAVQNTVFAESFEPVFGYGEAAEEDVLLNNSVLGVYITSSALTPQIARKRVRALGDYVATTIVNMKIYRYFGTMRISLESEILGSKTAILKLEETIDDLKTREALISDGLIGLYNRDVYERQVVQVTSATEKYLPPHQQLVATKVHLNNVKIQLSKLNIKINRDNLLLGFVDNLDQYFVNKNEYLVNKSLLEQITLEHHKYFTAEIIKEDIKAFYTIEAKLLGFTSIKKQYLFFVSEPQLPTGTEGPRKSRVAILIFFVILGTYMGYEVFRSWWNQEA